MARPIKMGLDFFSVPVDWLRSLPMRKLMRACGPASVAVIMDVWCTAFGDQGYYLAWDDDALFAVADDVGIKETQVEAVVSKAIAVGLFDSGNFSGHSVLTSYDMQQQFAFATQRRNHVEINSAYSLLLTDSEQKPHSNGINVNNNGVNVDNNSVNVDKSTQRERERESKRDSETETDTSARGAMSVSDDFKYTIWDQYPKRTGYQSALDAYQTAIQTGETTKEAVLAKIAEYKQWIALNKTQQGYIKSAKSWFEGKGWLDEYKLDAPEKSSKTNRYGKPARTEPLPDWAQPGYKPEAKELSAEERADLQARLARLQAHATVKKVEVKAEAEPMKSSDPFNN